MFGIKKLKVLSWSVIISSSFLYSCSGGQRNSLTIQGSTQGTTYTIIVVDDSIQLAKTEIDSIFSVFDMSLSTYIDSSVISKINESDTGIVIEDPTNYFQRCYDASRVIYANTEGAFDPSVFPLVKGWGFMNNMEEPPSDQTIDSLLDFVSFAKNKLHTIHYVEDDIYVTKTPGFKLDFNAIAQGLSVDVITEYLDQKGYKDYYVEVGGELRVKGVNREGVKWKIGVDTPIEDLETRELENILHVTDKAVATSGNYRKYYVRDGVKYAHTLDPKTGRPVNHQLLSATVIANDCASADAYATAIMVVGLEKGLKLAQKNNVDIEVYLIYSDNSGKLQRKYSSGFEKYFQ